MGDLLSWEKAIDYWLVHPHVKLSWVFYRDSSAEILLSRHIYIYTAIMSIYQYMSSIWAVQVWCGRFVSSYFIMSISMLKWVCCLTSPLWKLFLVASYYICKTLCGATFTYYGFPYLFIYYTPQIFRSSESSLLHRGGTLGPSESPAVPQLHEQSAWVFSTKKGWDFSFRIIPTHITMEKWDPSRVGRDSESSLHGWGVSLPALFGWCWLMSHDWFWEGFIDTCQVISSRKRRIVR